MLAELERRGRPFADSALGMMRLLGAIEVQSRDARGVWRTVAEFNEAGPIATDTKVLPLPAAALAREPGAPLRLRLRLAKGSWRVDWLALAELGSPVQAVRLEAKAVERGGQHDDAAYASLRGKGRHLISMPGDSYRLVFDIPQLEGGAELFLESRGYYYEWVRREWLAGENPALALQAIRDPAAALRRLAPDFARREQSMDSLFWNSRFSRGGRYAAHQ
jgi:hypothetical protein